MEKLSSDAWQTMTQRVRRGLRGRASEQIVEDITQDVLIALLNHLGDIDDEEHLRRWLATAARNRFITEMRRQSARFRRESTHDVAGSDLSGDEEEELNLSVGAWLLDQIARLPAPYAQALQSIDVEGESQIQFAERHGLSASGARSRVQRGRRLLRELVASSCVAERDARGNFVRCTPRSATCCNG